MAPPVPGMEVATMTLENALTTAVLAIATIAPTLASSPIAAALATAISAAPPHPAHDGPPPPPPPNGECSLLGPFALIVQAALGGLALLALVFKRWRERPQRPLKIWAFDVSKQVVGSVLVHIANLLMSMLSSGQFSIKLDPSSIKRRMEDGPEGGKYQPNPCSFYLLNLAIDTTIGIPILIVLLRLLTAGFLLTPIGSPPESIRSGNYGNPPKTTWWFKQSIIYFCGLMGMKICVLIIFLILPWISHVGDWALRWTEGNEELQVFFVMLFFPVIMNATQYYIIDSYIKNQAAGEHELISGGDDESYDANRDCSSDDEGEEMEMSDEEEISKLKNDIKAQPKDTRRSDDRHHYDEQFDGTSPTVAGSGSSSGMQAKLLTENDSGDEEDVKKL